MHHEWHFTVQGGRAEQELGIPCMAIGWEPRIIIIVDGNLTGNIQDGNYNYSSKDGNINGKSQNGKSQNGKSQNGKLKSH